MARAENTFAKPGSIRIEWLPRDRYFICWRSHVSVMAADRREVLRFARWPASTPTGQALREWLDGLGSVKAEAVSVQELKAAGMDSVPEHLATGFGPECHDPADHDPTADTRTII